jgi:PAS domain S-box-containing protein
LLDLSNDAIIVRDLDDKISSWNKGAEKLYGWAAEEVIGKHLDSLLQTEFPKPMEEILAQLQSEGEFSGEVVQIARDGRRVAALCRWVLDRGTESILTSYTDITERRMLEDSLAARASDLVRADRSKDEFLAMLAHELRNPLAPLRNAVGLLARLVPPGTAARSAVEMSDRQVRHMTRLVNDLLDVSRITQGKIELRREPVVVAEAVRDVVDAIGPLAEQRGQRLTVRMPERSPTILADGVRIAQVLENLLSNASKYTDSGGSIDLCVEEEGEEVVIRVADTGIGIERDHLAQVFELFTQIDATMDRAEGGLGIGLSLVKRLVELHGGTVSAHSAGRGCGTSFVVRLPRFEAALAA